MGDLLEDRKIIKNEEGTFVEFKEIDSETENPRTYIPVYLENHGRVIGIISTKKYNEIFLEYKEEDKEISSKNVSFIFDGCLIGDNLSWFYIDKINRK